MDEGFNRRFSYIPEGPFSCHADRGFLISQRPDEGFNRPWVSYVPEGGRRCHTGPIYFVPQSLDVSLYLVHFAPLPPLRIVSL